MSLPVFVNTLTVSLLTARRALWTDSATMAGWANGMDVGFEDGC